MTMRGRNHLLWIGPLVAFTGAVSYFVVFAYVPVLRDFPWLNFPLVLAGIVVSVVGLWRAFSDDPTALSKFLAVCGLLACLGIGGLFSFYVLVLSNRLPSIDGVAAELATAPDFTLADQNGRLVTLSDFRGRNVVLVFYRGHW
jgi:hypothetical protein